ncbi:MAG TPA: carboxypeptidase-like regulatory domain-containing protein [Rhodanobacteraceae bacterium]
MQTSSTYSIGGNVDDAASTRPIGTATVSVIAGVNANRSVPTDANGAYTLDALLPGTMTLRAAASGFDAADRQVTVPASTPIDFALAETPPPAPRCDPGLWAHVHDVKRLKVVSACETATGVIVSAHSNDDGDIDMQLAVDPPYTKLLNSGNLQKLNGNLQTEAICQAKVHSDVPDALRSCREFTGTVPIPAIGTHVQVTGTYVLDQDHGWMELHPITALIH